jgi:methylmalonyl-CoA/ethylmalonyl-CoA epimerase
MIKKIDHLGIAVENAEDAIRFWMALGLAPKHVETVASQKVKATFLPAGETNIELLEPTEPDSPIAKYIEKNGGGIHHICVEVADIRKSLAALRALGFRLIHDEPIRGAHNKWVAFVHPKSTGGVLLELSQPME